MKPKVMKFLFAATIFLLLIFGAGLLVANATLSTIKDKTNISNNLVCTMDAKICPDGSSVGRDAANNCEFFPCPSARDSIHDKKDIFCTQDVRECPDGSFVGRDPSNGCAFFECP